MDQLKAQNKRFTESIFGWDVNEDGMLEPNWYEQDLIDWMDWQIEDNGMSAEAVARSLNARGITGKRGGQWQGQSVKRTISHKIPWKSSRLPSSESVGNNALAQGIKKIIPNSKYFKSLFF